MTRNLLGLTLDLMFAVLCSLVHLLSLPGLFGRLLWRRWLSANSSRSSSGTVRDHDCEGLNRLFWVLLSKAWNDWLRKSVSVLEEAHLLKARES